MTEKYAWGKVASLQKRNTTVGTVMIAFTAFVGLMWLVWSRDGLIMTVLGLAMAFGSIAGVAIPPSKVLTNVSFVGLLGRLSQIFLMWMVGTYHAASASAAGGASNSLAGLTFLWAVAMGICTIMRWRVLARAPKAIEHDGIAAQRAREEAYEQSLLREQRRISAPTAPGRTTGFEPAALAEWQLRRTPHMYGSPGAGLSGSGFSASAVERGQLGEVNFAKALDRTGLLPTTASFWSVQMPSDDLGASQRFNTDIDCVLVTGSTIFLLDMKNYVQGDVTWVQDGPTALRIVDNPTGNDIGKPRHMSLNMKMAQDVVTQRAARLGLKHKVVSRVVFMPTEAGMGQISPDLRWPGDIPAVPLEALLTELSQQPAFDPRHPDAEYVLRLFRVLVKDESGSAARPGQSRPAAVKVAPQAGGAPTAPRTQAASGSVPGSVPTQASPTADATDVSDRITEPTPQKRRCAECQAEMEPEAQFCFTCGASA